MITIPPEAFPLFTPSAQQEMLDYAAGRLIVDPTPKVLTKKVDYSGFDMTTAADMTPANISKFFEVCSDEYKQGIRLFAEKGPIIDFNEITALGIKRTQFQSRTTVRTRTVLNDSTSRLMGWDDWETTSDGQEYTKGNYAVSTTTYHSLRKYFGLD